MQRDDSESQAAVAVVWRAIWTSRLVVLLSGMFAVLSFGRRPGTQAFDPANLTAPFGYFGNLLAAPFARWDSVWYLAIAQGGYDHEADAHRVLSPVPTGAARTGPDHRI